jgi:hypothetical protein
MAGQIAHESPFVYADHNEYALPAGGEFATTSGTERPVLALSLVWVLSGIVWSCTRAGPVPYARFAGTASGRRRPSAGDSSWAAGATSGCSLPGDHDDPDNDEIAFSPIIMSFVHGFRPWRA